MICRFSSFVATAALAAATHAFVLIDDFTVGGFTKTLRNEESFSKEEFGLDKARVAFGTRQNSLRINSNPNNTELTVHVGGGEQAVRSPLPVMWHHDLGYGDLNFAVDFSAESEFWVDLETAHPANGLADNWDLHVMDANGVTASNGGWLHRPEGIRFRMQAFSRQVDWSRTVFMNFKQDWNDLPNPLEYKVTKFYAVPEPSSMILGLAGVAWLRAKKARSRAA